MVCVEIILIKGVTCTFGDFVASKLENVRSNRLTDTRSGMNPLEQHNNICIIGLKEKEVREGFGEGSQ